MYVTLLKNFNNYLNRIIKGYSTTPEYTANYDYHTIENVNFIEADGVNTEQIVNFDEWEPDYVLINREGDGKLMSRWFVLEAYHIRKGQLKLTLKRDVVYDNLQSVLNAPCYIQKATAAIDNPLIYNSEGMKFNQIKTSERQLSDSTKIAWIVGYMSSKQDDATVKSILANKTITYKSEANEIYTDMNDFNSRYAYASYTTTKHSIVLTKSSFQYGVNNILGSNRLVTITSDGKRTSFNTTIGDFTGYICLDGFDTTQFGDELKGILSNRLTTDSAALKTALGDVNVDTDVEIQNNKIVKIGTKYYKISVTTSINQYERNVTSNFGSAYTNMKSDLDAIGNRWQQKATNNLFYNVSYNDIAYKLSLVEILNYTSTATFDTTSYTEDNFQVLNDAPYTMFAIPYPIEGTDYFKYHKLKFSDNTTCDFSKEMALSIVNTMSLALQTAIYDIQLLPYCPLENINTTIESVTSFLDTVVTDLSLVPSYQILNVKTGSNKVGVVLFAVNSSFKRRIPIIGLYTDDLPRDPIEYKVARETRTYRLTSPNYSSFDEFDPYMNDGVDYIEAECTYKPYNPYIHLSINYKGLYGKDFDDARGLICGGDFSLPRMSDAWESYQISNKNYSNIFDRQQQNLILNQKWQKQDAIINAVTGSLAGAGVAAAAGATVGGGIPGAVAGGVIGGATSALGAGHDLAILSQKQKEQLSYQEDMYNYNLQNIQAMPQGLAKNSGFNYNNKVFPVMELYSCTNKEKEAFRNKLKYNGMTIMAIDTISNYIQVEPSYIQGQIIRLEDITNDYHMAMSIYEEIAKGIYI